MILLLPFSDLEKNIDIFTRYKTPKLRRKQYAAVMRILEQTKWGVDTGVWRRYNNYVIYYASLFNAINYDRYCIDECDDIPVWPQQFHDSHKWYMNIHYGYNFRVNPIPLMEVI